MAMVKWGPKTVLTTTAIWHHWTAGLAGWHDVARLILPEVQAKTRCFQLFGFDPQPYGPPTALCPREALARFGAVGLPAPQAAERLPLASAAGRCGEEVLPAGAGGRGGWGLGCRDGGGELGRVGLVLRWWVVRVVFLFGWLRQTKRKADIQFGGFSR